MNQLQRLFEYQGKQVRTIIRDGEPWFVAKDVCEVFSDTNYRRSVARLDDDEKGVSPVSTPGGVQEMTVINEAGLYSLLFHMQPQKKSHMSHEQYEQRVQALKKFKRWVTHEVLPSIRKTGTYSVTQYRLPQTYAEALRMLADEVEEHERTKKQLSIAAPKAEMYDVALSAKNAQSMSIVAKTLGWGRNRLFAFLRDKGVLRHNNEPYQEYVERGYFVVRQVPISRSSGVQNKPQTLVTAKGMDYIGKLLKENGLLEGREAN